MLPLGYSFECWKTIHKYQHKYVKLSRILYTTIIPQHRVFPDGHQSCFKGARVFPTLVNPGVNLSHDNVPNQLLLRFCCLHAWPHSTITTTTVTDWSLQGYQSRHREPIHQLHLEMGTRKDFLACQHWSLGWATCKLECVQPSRPRSCPDELLWCLRLCCCFLLPPHILWRFTWYCQVLVAPMDLIPRFGEHYYLVTFRSCRREEQRICCSLRLPQMVRVLM